ncbi:MAG: aminotransferase class I/II-fold pyridoxal phosphate-dependent enzyme [Desulfobacterales bacterium]
MSDNAAYKLETKLVHAGEPEKRIEGAVSMPVFQSSTFEYSGQADYHELKYIRLNNTPNHAVLHKKLAALENGQAAVVMSSGMAAISTVLLAILKPGDHLLAQDCLYGGTHELICKDLAEMGITHDLIEGDRPRTWEEKIRPQTKVIYMETLSNPLLQVPDLKAAAAFAQKHGLISLIDNTFASPVNFRPLEHGFDISLHSCTKYLNGHTDIVAGAAIGSAEMIKKITRKLNHLGGSLDPHACFLLHRGIKTLALRVKCQNENAMQVAEFLNRHDAVQTVHYPGLKSHPGHERARDLFAGFGGMLSFEVKGGLENAEKVLHSLRIPIVAPSLGGVESLITRPATTSHSGMSRQDREKAGISDSLIRVSVGIEAAEDLMADFAQALDRV